MRPTFLGIGVTKCATTTLYAYLNGHPDVSMYRRKEMNYFNTHMPEGMSLADYESLGYDPSKRAAPKAVGEFTPAYVDHVPALHAAYPGLPLIMIIRNPVARFLSHYRHSLDLAAGRSNCGVDTDLLGRPKVFAEPPSLRRIMQRIRLGYPPPSVTRGRYEIPIQQAEQLGHPLLVLDYHEVTTNQPAAFRKVCAFLDIPYQDAGPILVNAGEERGGAPVRLRLKQRAKLTRYYAQTVGFVGARYGIDLTL